MIIFIFQVKELKYSRFFNSPKFTKKYRISFSLWILHWKARYHEDNSCMQFTTHSWIDPIQIFALFVLLAHTFSINGDFDNKFNWKLLEEGLDEAKSEKKPAIIIIHKSWCPSSLSFAKRFSSSSDIRSLMQKYVFISLMDDDEPLDDKFSPGMLIDSF